jgi:phospholipid/cholesterol/gamma-HCH transport system ATP-binding protein
MVGPMIRAVDLYKRFGHNQVLRGLSLDFEPGTITVILGGSGSGKSVFMKHLIGLLRPDAGEVWIDGIDLARLKGRDLHRVRMKFGMVFQMAALFDSMTVYENVEFPLNEHRKDLSRKARCDRVFERLEALGLAEAATRYPAELSGGMRKRVGLARAVVLDPQVVLYDEPTTGLDPLTTEGVDGMILEAKRAFGVTSIVISHDIGSSFRIADRLAFLCEGQIVAEGPPAEFAASSHPRVREFLASYRRGAVGTEGA